MAPLMTVDVHLPGDFRRQALEHDARTGLTATPKALPPVWFYDDRGSALFDEITRLDEYYLTRAERSILAAWAPEIVRSAGCDTLVELGAGTSEKTRLLLDAMAGQGALRRVVPFDVSEQTLRDASSALAGAYGVEVCAVVGDFHRHLGLIPQGGRRLVAFLGSTIGNLDQAQRGRFLRDLDSAMSFDDRLLIGTDLVKDPARLVAAYDDARGVTAAFNRNVLHVLNRELGAHFDPEAFAHEARWVPEEDRIEMWLRAERAMVVPVDGLGLEVAFARGEAMRTELSCKFTPERVRAELWDGGFEVERSWTDPAGDFLLTLARPYC